MKRSIKLRQPAQMRGTRTNNIDRHRRDRSGEYNSAPSELPSLGYGDEVLNEVGVLLERIDNRLTLGNLSLVKRYCDGNLNSWGKPRGAL
jgi:hypothetical protein